MNKFVIVCLALVACAFAAQPKSTGSDAEKFFDGFSTAYGLHNQYEVLLTCIQSYAPDTLKSVGKVFEDLAHKHVKDAVLDLFVVFQNIQNLKSVCPQAVLAYLYTFNSPIAAFIGNKAAFAEQVAKDLKNDKIHTIIDTIKVALDVHNHNAFKAGEDFGALTKIALSAYLSPSKRAFLAAVEEESDDSYVQLLAMNPTQQNAVQFFQGFANSLGLSQAANSLLTCASIDATNFVSDLKGLIKHVHDKAWNTLIADGMSLYGDFQALKADCPAGANPFINEFAPVIKAAQANQAAFLNQVGNNLKQNLFPVMAGIAQLVQNFESQNFTKAGNAFGSLVAVALKGYLPN